MAIAELTATRSTCDRAHVGCVLVNKENRIVSTGYNGSIAGAKHCDEAGHLIVNERCVRGAHSEQNAVSSAARAGVPVGGCLIFVTHFPCWNCFKSLFNAGISGIIYKELKLNGMSKEIYDEIFACRGKISIEPLEGVEFYHLHPQFKNGLLVGLE